MYRPDSSRTAGSSSIPVGQGEALATAWNGDGTRHHRPHGRPDPPHQSTPTEFQKEIAGLDFRITVILALAAPGLFNTAFRRWRSPLPGTAGPHRRNAYCFSAWVGFVSFKAGTLPNVTLNLDAAATG